MSDRTVSRTKKGADNALLAYISLTASATLLASLLVTVTLLAIIVTFALSEPDLSHIQDLFTFPVDMFKPEPLERRLFMSALLIFPLALCVCWCLLAPLVRRITDEHIAMIARFTGVALLLLTTLLTGFCIWRDSWFTRGFTPALLALVAVAVSAALLIARSSPDLFKSRWFGWCADTLALLLATIVALFSVYGINVVIDSTIYNNHFNSVFHAVVQVFLGKELLVDLTHMYGLYPHLLEPLFRLTGLSVLSFTIVMGLMTGTGYLCLYLTLRTQLRSRFLAVAGLGAVVYFNYLLLRSQTHDPYFQYHPIRFLFPALSIYLASRYLCNPGWALYFTIFVSNAVALLWNFDSGFVVSVAWLLLLVYRESFRPSLRGLSTHVICGVGITTVIVAAFSVYMRFRYGSFPDYSDFFSYQKLFYIYGFKMLPMPILHPWNLVILTYLVGLLYAVVSRAMDDRSVCPQLVLFIALLGIGLFAYYQGRSHDHVLTLVCYPAVMLLTIAADLLLQTLHKSRVGIRMLTAASAFLVLFLAVAGLFRSLPDFLNIAWGRIKPTLSGSISPAMRNAEFVSQMTKPGEGVLILSHLSGVYYLMSRTICPVRIPGTTELFMVSDYQRIQAYLRGNACGKVIVDDDFVYDKINPGKNVQKELIWNLLKTRFQLAASTPEGEMILFVPAGWKAQ